jgi:predicted HTH transcriptional regulator
LRLSQKEIRTEAENLNAWVRFFLQSLKKQKDILQQKVEREHLLEKLAPVSERIMTLTKERGKLAISDAVTLLEINRNTAKLHFRQLVESGHLVQHGTGRATWYTAGR